MKNQTQIIPKLNNINNGNSIQGLRQANLSFDKIPASTMRTYNDIDSKTYRPQSSLQQQSIQQVSQDFQTFQQDHKQHHLSEQEFHHPKRPQSTALLKQQSSTVQAQQQPSHKPPSNALKSLKFLTATQKINQIQTNRNSNTERFLQNQHRQQQQLQFLEVPQSIHSLNKPSIQSERTFEGDRKSLHIMDNHLREYNLSEERWRQAENYSPAMTATIKDEELGVLRGKRLAGNKKKEFEQQKALLREKAAVLREEIKRKKDLPLEIKDTKQMNKEREQILRNHIEILALSCRVESAYPEEIEYVIRNIEKQCFFDQRAQLTMELRDSIIALDINKKIRNMLCSVNPGQHWSLDRVVNLLFEELLHFDQQRVIQKDQLLQEIQNANQEAQQAHEMMEQMKLQMERFQEETTQLQTELKNEKNLEDIQTKTNIKLDKKYADQHAKIERLQLRINDLNEENNILKSQNISYIQTINEFRTDNQGLQNEITRLNECILDMELETQQRKDIISQEKKKLQGDLNRFQDKIEEYCDNVNLKAGEVLRDPNNYYAKYVRENNQSQIGSNKESRWQRDILSKVKKIQNNSLIMNNDIKEKNKLLETNKTLTDKNHLDSSGSSWDDEDRSKNNQNKQMNTIEGANIEQVTNKSSNQKTKITGEVKKQMSYQNPSWLREDS